MDQPTLPVYVIFSAVIKFGNKILFCLVHLWFSYEWVTDISVYWTGKTHTVYYEYFTFELKSYITTGSMYMGLSLS